MARRTREGTQASSVYFAMHSFAGDQCRVLTLGYCSYCVTSEVVDYLKEGGRQPETKDLN